MHGIVYIFHFWIKLVPYRKTSKNFRTKLQAKSGLWILHSYINYSIWFCLINNMLSSHFTSAKEHFHIPSIPCLDNNLFLLQTNIDKLCIWIRTLKNLHLVSFHRCNKFYVCIFTLSSWAPAVKWILKKMNCWLLKKSTVPIVWLETGQAIKRWKR